jgi:hypothetical protein
MRINIKMGYSIAVFARSSTRLEKMKNFMDENYVNCSELCSDVKSSINLSDGPTRDLAYDEGILSYGFNYSCLHDLEREYVFGICMWMACKVGKLDKETLTHYIRYDGFERIPVRCEALGWKKPSSKNMEHYMVLSPGYSEENLEVIHNELLRLDELWDERT